MQYYIVHDYNEYMLCDRVLEIFLLALLVFASKLNCLRKEYS